MPGDPVLAATLGLMLLLLVAWPYAHAATHRHTAQVALELAVTCTLIAAALVATRAFTRLAAAGWIAAACCASMLLAVVSSYHGVSDWQVAVTTAAAIFSPTRRISLSASSISGVLSRNGLMSPGAPCRKKAVPPISFSIAERKSS